MSEKKDIALYIILGLILIMLAVSTFKVDIGFFNTEQLENATLNFNTSNVREFYTEVAKGNIPYHNVLYTSGTNPSVSINSIIDITDYADEIATINYLSSSTTLYASSTDAGDNTTITILGLDQNWVEQTQTVTLNGQNQVEINGSWIRFFNAYNYGTSSLNGDVYIAESTASPGGEPTDKTKVQGKIIQGNGRTYHGSTTIPANKTGYVIHYYSTIGKNEEVLFKTFIRPEGGVFITDDIQKLFEGYYNPVVWQMPEGIPEKTDIKINLKTLSQDTDFYFYASILLVDNNYTQT